jgi:hypothetical protein
MSVSRLLVLRIPDNDAVSTVSSFKISTTFLSCKMEGAVKKIEPVFGNVKTKR